MKRGWAELEKVGFAKKGYEKTKTLLRAQGYYTQDTEHVRAINRVIFSEKDCRTVQLVSCTPNWSNIDFRLSFALRATALVGSE